MNKVNYPFPAIVGQDDLKLALILNVINPSISGVLIRGEKGTAKSTAVRAIAGVLPEIDIVEGCPFSLPEYGAELCDQCRKEGCSSARVLKRRVSVTELPVGATEDRVVGSLNIESALKTGEKQFDHGILATANRGILYVDEVNLLEDHIVDVLLDSAAMGVNSVEREGVSFSHPARFTLVGTMNPEEGELRPQLLDRFGLCVTVDGIRDAEKRVEVIKRRLAFEEDPAAFAEEWQPESTALNEKIVKAVSLLKDVSTDRDVMMRIAVLCMESEVDGHRADIIMLKTAKTLAAWNGRTTITDEDIRTSARLVLPHRMRRQPFQNVGKVS